MNEKVIQIPAEIGLMAAHLNELPMVGTSGFISARVTSDDKEVHLCDWFFSKAFSGITVSKGPHCDIYDRKWIVIDRVEFFCLVNRPKAVKETQIEIVEGE